MGEGFGVVVRNTVETGKTELASKGGKGVANHDTF